MNKSLLGSTKTIFQNVDFGPKAHKEILAGAEILYRAVKSTMGPSGHNVIIENGYSAPLITKDGVTVAKSINLREKLPAVGAELLKEIAAKTNEMTGDGPQPLYSNVLTPKGWVKMGDLKIGDEICGTNKTKQRVLGVFPKGKKEIIKVTTSDGRIIECCEDHLWTITTSYGKKKTLTTKELMDIGVVKNDGGHKKHNFFISISPVEFVDNSKTLDIHPYTLGVLLGDGSLSEKNSIEIATGLSDSYILTNMILPKGYKLSNKIYEKKHYVKSRIIKDKTTKPGKKIKNLISELGLLGKDSHTKFIPEKYLFSTIKNREDLLNGLIDTDGHINKRGLFEFNTTSKRLCDDVVKLCRSLGKQVSVYEYDREFSNTYGRSKIYRVTELKGYKHGVKIKSIEKTGNWTDMQCIKVSNPDHLYITDDFTPTHNTTTCTVLGYTMLSQGVKMVSTGRSSIQIKRGMDKAIGIVTESLKKMAIQVRDNEDIISIGTISANGDRQIGTLLCEAINKVGQDGIITIEPAKSVHTTLEVVQGMQTETGYVSPYFVTNQEKLTCELTDPLVLITDKKLSVLAEILPALEIANQSGRPLLIIADQVEGEVLHTLIVNKMKGVLFSCAINAPSYGENRSNILHDIALVTGGTVFDATVGTGLKSITLEDFGECEKVIVGRSFTTLVGKQGEEKQKQIDERVETIRAVLEKEKSIDDLRRNNLKNRLAKLAGGIAVIKVGGSTEVEIMEKKDRVEDALNATVAAVQEGILPGGGTALFYAAEDLLKALQSMPSDLTDDEAAGFKVIYEACRQPLRVIVENTGASADVVMNKLKSNLDEKEDIRFGYDANKGVYCDLVDCGIIDPLKVERFGLLHACSIIGLLLTCNAVVTSEVVNSGEAE